MVILGIETSCDETAMAVLEVTPRQARGEEITILSNVVSSQVKLHAKYGGIVPNLAAREHVKNIGHVFKLALKKAKIKNIDKQMGDMDVTYADISKAKQLLGWSPEIDINQGIKEFVDWFKEIKRY